MRIPILGETGQENTAENAVSERSAEIRHADALGPVERLYLFAGWTLEESARDLFSPTGRRVDLTSSEFDLLLTFVRKPGRALSRDALLGALRGREWSYFDRSIDTLVAAAQEAGQRRRPASAGPLGARGRLCFLRRRRQGHAGRAIRRRLSAIWAREASRIDAARKRLLSITLPSTFNLLVLNGDHASRRQ